MYVRKICEPCRDERHRLCERAQSIPNLCSYLEGDVLTETHACCDGKLVWNTKQRLNAA